jgi:hypothetical protein
MYTLGVKSPSSFAPGIPSFLPGPTVYHEPMPRPEFTLRLLLHALPAEERERCLARLRAVAGTRQPWSEDDLPAEPLERCTRWTRFEPERFARQTVGGLCGMLEVELEAGLITYATPDDRLSRLIRTFWLWRHGQRIGQVYHALVRLVGEQRARSEASQVFGLL